MTIHTHVAHVLSAWGCNLSLEIDRQAIVANAVDEGEDSLPHRVSVIIEYQCIKSGMWRDMRRGGGADTASVEVNPKHTS